MKKSNQTFVRRQDMMSLLFAMSDLQIYTGLELKDFTCDIHAKNEIEEIVIQASGGRYRLNVNGRIVNLYESQDQLIEVLINPDKRIILSEKISDLTTNKKK